MHTAHSTRRSGGRRPRRRTRRLLASPLESERQPGRRPQSRGRGAHPGDPAHDPHRQARTQRPGRPPRPHARRLRWRAPHGRRSAGEHRREPPFRGCCRQRCCGPGGDAHELAPSLVRKHGRPGVKWSARHHPDQHTPELGLLEQRLALVGHARDDADQHPQQRLGVLRIVQQAGHDSYQQRRWPRWRGWRRIAEQ